MSSDWIRRSTARLFDADGHAGYGCLWWCGDLGGETPVVYANGRGSRFIGWLPERDLVIVVPGGNEDNGKQFAIAGLLTVLLASLAHS